MKVLMIGDIVGRAGRHIVTELLPKFKKEEDIDWVIANGENLAGGLGLNKKTLAEILEAGVDIVTSGNHIWHQKESVEILNRKDSPVLRPINYPPDTAGAGWRVFTNAYGRSILVISAIGRVFFRENLDCPFRAIDNVLNKELKQNAIDADSLDGIFVDFHAEATSEKVALANYLAGRVTAVCGTHTHIPTCDERIINDGTAYVTDLGMAGTVDSVLGVDKEIIIKQFLTQLPQRFVWKTSGATQLTGVVIKTKKGSNKALSIKRIFWQLD